MTSDYERKDSKGIDIITFISVDIVTKTVSFTF